MVTQTAPEPSTATDVQQEVAYQRGLPVTPAAAVEAVHEWQLPAPLQAPAQVDGFSSNKGIVARIVARLVAFNDWLSGPAATKRERWVRELEVTERIRQHGTRYPIR